MELVITEASIDDRKVIDKGLTEYNQSKVPFGNYADISRVIKLGDEIIAGIIADISPWNILEIETLWVSEHYRQRGYAKALMDEVERLAKSMGSHLSQLDTFDFQAKSFYDELGYKVFGILEDHPKGHMRYYMSKKL
ncbi:MAG: GNAT family N-acetyltransferase [Promicromonosporaceae bacterium]|nr:GNAT family N-acetyltransferase [Promicromonosporaceae bacterium]